MATGERLLRLHAGRGDTRIKAIGIARSNAYPSEYMDVLAPLLPSKYAPLRSIGTGLQSVYLTRLPEALAAALIDLIGVEARDIIRGNLLLGGVLRFNVAPSPRPSPKGEGENRSASRPNRESVLLRSRYLEVR